MWVWACSQCENVQTAPVTYRQHGAHTEKPTVRVVQRQADVDALAAFHLVELSEDARVASELLFTNNCRLWQASGATVEMQNKRSDAQSMHIPQISNEAIS